MPPPADHVQVEMLLKLQRVLADGQFTASYKFARLQSLADLAVERGDDSGDAMLVPVAAIAEKFMSIDLYEFLFGSERSPLGVYLDVLREIQRGACFYCGRVLGERPHVDHFVPWSRYPFDLAHNFVLADDQCNDSKTSRLADVPHLERWCERNEVMEPTLRQ